MATKAQTQKRQGQNGNQPNGDKLAEAIAHEEAIRVEADAIWTDDERGGLDELDSSLFRRLRPLLRKPIPSGFIEHVPPTGGKPYESTGVRSVQVQFDRLDNVLGPENWGYSAAYSEGGKLCHVVAWVGDQESPLFTRESYGGVQAGTGEGNIRKGAFTNAAKLAFARLGPGWEVYVGAADFDPDTDKAAAEQQAKPDDGATEEPKLTAEQAERLAGEVEKAGLTDHLPSKLRGFGVDKLTDLTTQQAIKVYEWAKGGESE